MKKKILLFTISMLCILAISVGTTFALLISLTGPVKNTFTVGNVEIALTETTGDKYKLIPGTTVQKNPKITVKADSESCWLFVKINTDTALSGIISYSLSDGWAALSEFEGVYSRKVENINGDTAFSVLKDDCFTVKDTLDKRQMEKITQSQKFIFQAFAIQAHGLDNAHAAWTQLQTNLGE